MQIIQSKLLNNFPELTHGFTTKDGGRSLNPYVSLNLAFHVGDDIINVNHNHTLLAQEMNYKKESLVHMKQIHSNIVKTATDKNNFENPLTCDALITNAKDIPLMVMVADCSPILFYDVKKRVIAVAHAGRAGAFKNIVQNVINSFSDIFHSNLADIVVSVGPSIGNCCYEVSEEILSEAKELGLDFAMSKRQESYYLDISSILKNQLLKAKIKAENIEFSDECSCCQNDKYFSYRAQNVTGRFAGIIYLN